MQREAMEADWMSHETRPDMVLIAIPTRCRSWFNDCKGCALELDPPKCVKFNADLKSIRGHGCKTNQRWIRPA